MDRSSCMEVGPKSFVPYHQRRIPLGQYANSAPMIGTVPSPGPGLYSAVFTDPDHVLWCARPKPCPASCEATAAISLAYVPRASEKTKTTLGVGSVKLP